MALHIPDDKPGLIQQNLGRTDPGQGQLFGKDQFTGVGFIHGEASVHGYGIQKAVVDGRIGNGWLRCRRPAYLAGTGVQGVQTVTGTGLHENQALPVSEGRIMDAGVLLGRGIADEILVNAVLGEGLFEGAQKTLSEDLSEFGQVLPEPSGSLRILGIKILSPYGFPGLRVERFGLEIPVRESILIRYFPNVHLGPRHVGRENQTFADNRRRFGKVLGGRNGCRPFHGMGLPVDGVHSRIRRVNAVNPYIEGVPYYSGRRHGAPAAVGELPDQFSGLRVDRDDAPSTGRADHQVPGEKRGRHVLAMGAVRPLYVTGFSGKANPAMQKRGVTAIAYVMKKHAIAAETDDYPVRGDDRLGHGNVQIGRAHV